MIRINLLGVERQKARKTATFLDANQRVTFACCAVFGLTALAIGGWYWSLSSQASGLQTEIAAAQAEASRLTKVLAEVKRAEDRRGQLQQRVAIIEELRRGQGVPVQMLDHVSRSMPDFLWLTALEQKADSVHIEGRTTTLISLADFVGNLGTNKLVQKPIDIVNSEVESKCSQNCPADQDVIKFAVNAPLTQHEAAPATETPKKGRAKAPAAR